jgi:phosphatidylserine/phosphatidylglycerophosphate/cardiolipin synthase-like enzyme
VTPLIHGTNYFSVLLDGVRALGEGDVLLFTDWRGDPDQVLDGPGSEVSRVFCAAAERGVVVKGLVWRSHLDRLQFSEEENRHLGEELEEAGGECLLDMRVRVGGSHHQKFVVLRHRDRPEADVAFVGGIDLCHSRRDDSAHHGDVQVMPMPSAYGDRPPWHDIQLAIRGPAVGDVETVFRERWTDPAPLTRNPLHRLRAVFEHEDTFADRLPPQLPDPPPCGPHTVQLLRTYPYRRKGYQFAPNGERSVARGYLKVLTRAKSLIYVEDQYLWSRDVARPFADALEANPDLRLIAVIPRFPDQDGRLSRPPNLLGHQQALTLLSETGGDRVAVYSLENHAGTPVYVHAKACIIDDTWAVVGSDNFNRRSWTHDSELSCATLDATPDLRAPRRLGEDSARVYARNLRLALNREHLDRQDGDDLDLCDPKTVFDLYQQTAAALDAWHDGGERGPRPPGRLRRYPTPALSRWTTIWATALYRTAYDPDGRPPALRRAGAY